MKKLGCAKCGGTKKMKPGGPVERAKKQNDKAKAKGYESYAAMKQAKGGIGEKLGAVGAGLGSIALAGESIKRLLKKDEQKRGGTIKNKKVSSRPKKRK
jgi:hypothetical protein